MGGGSKQTIGYRYFMGLHFGLCRGPVDAFIELRGGDRSAWAGQGYEQAPGPFGQLLGTMTPTVTPVGEVTESRRIRIYAPGLWGGEKKEGGINGDLDVMMGEPAQAPNDYLLAKVGSPMPAFRGLFSLVFRGGMVGAMNPYPKPWKFKVRRIKKGWEAGICWYPEKAEVPVVSGALQTVYPDLALDAGKARTTPDEHGVTVSLGPHESLTVELASGLTYGGWSRWWADDAPGTGGLPWEASFRTRDASGAIISHFPTRYATAAQALAAAQAAGPVTLSGSSHYTFWLFDDVLSNRGGLSLRIKKTQAALAMNPAHIVYECLTNTDWGLGYPASVIDDPNFRAAADVFHDEGMGLCLQWVRQDTVQGFIQDVMNHAGAVCAQDPRTSLFRILPIRGGYNVATLPEFRRGLNVISLEGFQRAAIPEMVNEVTVEYTDVTTGKKVPVTVQNLAAIQAQGGVSPQTTHYPGLPTMDLGQRVALRDLDAKSQPLCKVSLRVDRSAYGILPGEVVRWSDSRLGIVDMPMRVLRVDYGTLTEGAITLDLAEDVFGLPATGYVVQQPDGWEPPAAGANPSPAVDAFEVPYAALVAAQGASAVQALDPAAGFVGMVAAAPAGISTGFQLYTQTGAGDYTQRGSGEWSPGGVLAVEVAELDTTLVLAGAVDFDRLSVGMLAQIGTGDAAELVRLESGDADAGTLVVSRGCADTVPKPWPVGTRVMVVDESAAVDGTEYASGEVVSAKAVTEASGEAMPVSAAPADSVTLAQRQARPYPPGLFRINGESFPAAASATLSVTWAHRDRVLQADQLVPHGAASTGPEPGTTYTMRTYLAGALIDTQAGIAGTAATVTPAGDGLVRIELEAVRDGLTSWQKYAHEFNYTALPVGTRVTVAGDRRVAVGGNVRTTIG